MKPKYGLELYMQQLQEEQERKDAAYSIAEFGLGLEALLNAQKELANPSGLKKYAAAAKLIRTIAAAQKKGMPVSTKQIETLARKTQSTAERQAKYFDQNLPATRSPTMDRTGRSLGDLNKAQAKAKELAKDLQAELDDVNEVMSVSRLQQFVDRQTVANQLRALLLHAQEAQQRLQQQGVDIGRMRGTITPAVGKVEPRFDPMATIYAKEVTSLPSRVRKPATLTEVIVPMERVPSQPSPASSFSPVPFVGHASPKAFPSALDSKTLPLPKN